mmetsp:Transcript_53833/g.125824  ORF Transcript_53833/g.125824 Transcript_53833/m.125824 type:complete len:259 (+) Transcript_53833:2108-2884(+)
MPPARGVPRHAEADDPAVLGQRQGPAPYVPGNRRELAPAGRDECEPARRHALQAAQHKQAAIRRVPAAHRRRAGRGQEGRAREQGCGDDFLLGHCGLHQHLSHRPAREGLEHARPPLYHLRPAFPRARRVQGRNHRRCVHGCHQPGRGAAGPCGSDRSLFARRGGRSQTDCDRSRRPEQGLRQHPRRVPLGPCRRQRRRHPQPEILPVRGHGEHSKPHGVQLNQGPHPHVSVGSALRASAGPLARHRLARMDQRQGQG